MGPSVRLTFAHDSAMALVSGVQGGGTAEILQWVLDYVGEHGREALAELWSAAPVNSLPGSLWRLYVVHASIVADLALSDHAYQQGVDNLDTIDGLVAGSLTATRPEDIRDLADKIFCGSYRGDLAEALDRTADYCSIEANGLTSLIAHTEIGSSSLLERAVTLAEFATNLHEAAVLARQDRLA